MKGRSERHSRDNISFSVFICTSLRGVACAPPLNCFFSFAAFTLLAKRPYSMYCFLCALFASCKQPKKHALYSGACPTQRIAHMFILENGRYQIRCKPVVQTAIAPLLCGLLELELYAPNSARRTAATNQGYSGLSGEIPKRRASHSGHSTRNPTTTSSNSDLQKQHCMPFTSATILDGSTIIYSKTRRKLQVRVRADPNIGQFLPELGMANALYGKNKSIFFDPIIF